MGVRMALGAERPAIVRLVLARGAAQLAVGMALGLGMGATMGGPMRFILYGVEAGDPGVYVAIGLTLAVVGMAACVSPARTATRADPVEVMRVG